jgi:hypothetical protein
VASDRNSGNDPWSRNGAAKKTKPEDSDNILSCGDSGIMNIASDGNNGNIPLSKSEDVLFHYKTMNLF